MCDNHRFRMADGAELVGHQGDSFEIRVSIPSDDNGFFGRQCPECSLVFRMDAQQYEALPDDLTLWCVYCGHHAAHSEFMTEQQRDRIMRAADDFAMQMVSQELDEIFAGLARSSRGGSISFSYKKPQPFHPARCRGSTRSNSFGSARARVARTTTRSSGNTDTALCAGRSQLRRSPSMRSRPTPTGCGASALPRRAACV